MKRTLSRDLLKLLLRCEEPLLTYTNSLRRGRSRCYLISLRVQRQEHSLVLISYLRILISVLCQVFYRTVRSILARGVDCVVINRRSVAPLESFGEAPELAALEVGWAHPGFDCFVFPTAWVEDFVANAACVGIGWVMRSLLYNLVVKARRMVILRNAHLTYHYGDDRPWNAPELDEYTQHNLGEARAVAKALSNDPAKKLALDEFCSAHGEYETEVFSEGGRKGRRVTLAKVAKKIASWGGRRTRSR